MQQPLTILFIATHRIVCTIDIKTQKDTCGVYDLKRFHPSTLLFAQGRLRVHSNKSISIFERKTSIESVWYTEGKIQGVAYIGEGYMIIGTHIGILKRSHLQRSRRIVYVLAFIAATILTPPDIISELLLAIPLIILFKSTTLYSSILQKHH